MDSFDKLVSGFILGLIAATGGVIALGDHVGVPVLGHTPTSGESPAVTTAVRITFGQPVDPQSAEEHFSIQPEVEGDFRWQDTTLVFQPQSALEPGQTYTVTLAAGVANRAGRQTIRPTRWSFTPRQPAVLALAPADSAVRGLWRIPLEGGEPQALYAPEQDIYSFAACPDGAVIAVSGGNAEQGADIWLVDVDGGNPRLIVDCGADFCGAPAWSPDGDLLAYERQSGGGPGRIWLFDPSAGDSQPVYSDESIAGHGPVWSPDGGRLAMFDANAQSIRVLDLADGNSMLLPSLMGEVGSFSPDGATMVYADIRLVGQQFFPELWWAELDVEGSLAPLLDNAEEDQLPVWSPDGRWIAFARRRLDRAEGNASQLYLFEPTSGELRQITDDPQYNHTGFAWDPTGSYLLVGRFDLTASSATPEVWVYGVSTGEFRPLISNALGAGWLP